MPICPVFFQTIARLPEQDWAGTDTPFVKTGMMQEEQEGRGETGEKEKYKEAGWGESFIWAPSK